MQRAGANRANEGGDEDSDDGSVDAAQDTLHGGKLAKLAPEGEDGDDCEQAGEKNCDEGKETFG